MAHQLFGFTADSFEQFVRAVALAVFGPGVTVFGDGPDGGREAIFKGTVPYPHPPAEQWSGYGVIQAKCKAKSEGTRKDQKWALDLLKEELELFVTKPRRSPKPEYYVYATNVDLTAGGKGWDAANALVKSYYAKLPLKGHAVWGASQISGYLDRFEQIRKRFTAYLTPGDVLAELIRSMERRQPNMEHILTTYLSRTLLDDEASRLDQAGKRTEEKLRLANLFIDLPATSEPSIYPPNEEPDADGDLPPGVLADLLRDGSRRLDPEAVYELETAETPGSKAPTRYVLLGTFGSGKSTINQLLAQIHRAALLERRPKQLLEAQVRKAIAEIKTACVRERLPWPATPRYPFRVELARFAKTLADGKVTTLADYLRDSIRGAAALRHEEFLEWLKLVPWLLILDGLDEVPPTSNRDVLVEAINTFLIEARHAGADLFVVATSRRDGYGGEFAGGVIAFMSLLPLSRPRALRYVKLYADTRFGATTQANDLIEKLSRTAENPLTAPLMSSPLQVTFMATVVSARGDPGQDRWQLFEKYYETIYDRELQKAIPPFQSVLHGQKDVIDRMHHEIGFWLQLQGEAAGVNSVGIHESQLRHLALSYLGPNGKGYLGRELEEKTDIILDAARRRLVFLTSRVEGELTFEVRGLQEYMAAECLMIGPERVMDRLKTIAASPYWRNVFLFAAGKVFSDAQSRHYQDSLRLLCEDLNTSNDAVYEIVHAGSDLALSILESGAPANNPHYTRHLSKLALELLNEPDILRSEGEIGEAERLAAVYRDSAEGVYCDCLRLRVGQTDLTRTLGAWPLLAYLVDRGHQWANEPADKYWPTDVKDQLRIFSANPDWTNSEWLRNKAYQMIPQVSPSMAFKNFGHMLPTIREKKNFDGTTPFFPSWAMAFDFLRNHLGESHISLFAPNADLEIGIRFVGLSRSSTEVNNKTPSDLRSMPSGHPAWIPFRVAYLLYENPGAQALATALRSCVDGGYDPVEDLDSRFWHQSLPWPLAACLRVAQSRTHLSDLALEAERGQLGDISEWRAAEERWKVEGISTADLTSTPELRKLRDVSIASIGKPVWTTSVSRHSREKLSLDALSSFLNQYEIISSCEIQSILSWIVMKLAIACEDLSESAVTRLVSLLEKEGEKLSVTFDLDDMVLNKDLSSPRLEFYNWCGLASNLFVRGTSQDFEGWERQCTIAYLNEPRWVGLLRLLSRCTSLGQAGTIIPSDLLSPGRYSDRRMAFAAVLIRLNQTNLTSAEASDLAGSAVCLLDPPAEAGSDYLLFGTIEKHLDRVPALETFLLELHKRIPLVVRDGVARCKGLLKRVVRKRLSGLQQPGQLAALGLPNLAMEQE